MDKEEEEMLPDEVIRMIFNIVLNMDIGMIKNLSLVNKDGNEITKLFLKDLKERIMKENNSRDMDCLFRYYTKKFLMCNGKIDIVYLKKHPSNIRIFVQSCIPWICYTKNEEFTYPYEGLDYNSVRNRFYLFAKMIEMVFRRVDLDNSCIDRYDSNHLLNEMLKALYLHIERNMKHFRNAFNIRMLITFLNEVYEIYNIREDPYKINVGVSMLCIYDWSVAMVSGRTSEDNPIVRKRVYREEPLKLMRMLAELEAQLLSCDNMQE